MTDRAASRPSAAEDAPEVLVVGMGNVLMRDDALGPHVVRTLAAGWETSPGTAVRDLGTPGADLIAHLRGARALVVIDTVRADGPPGRLLRYEKARLLERAPGPRASPHDPGLKEALLTLSLLGEAPEEVVLLGVIPGDVRSGLGLGPDVRRTVPWVEAAVLRELRRLGHPARPRAEPRKAELWWEQGRRTEPAEVEDGAPVGEIVPDPA